MTTDTLPAASTVDPEVAARVLRLHADVRRAAELIAPVWPLDRFVAVNPLGGLTHLPFEAACAETRRWRQVRTHLPLPTARELARHDGVDQAALRTALAEVAPEVAAAPPVLIGDRAVSAVELVLVDLEYGPPTPSTTPITSLGARATAPVPEPTRRASEELTAAWCAAFVDDHTATWAMSGRHEGFHRAWRRSLPHDPRARRILGRRAVAWLDALPVDPADALDLALTTIGIADEQRVDELRAQLVRLPGWTGHARWHDEWAPPSQAGPRLRLLDLAAVLTCLEVAALLHPERGSRRDPLSIAVPPIGEGSGHPAPTGSEQPALTARATAVCTHLDLPTDEAAVVAVRGALGPLAGTGREAVWMAAHERIWRDRLLHRIAAVPAPTSQDRSAVPTAQVLCCIDVRSEGLRRHLEASGACETFGVAGFFGIPLEWQPLGSAHAEARNPVLLTPANRVTEAPLTGSEAAAEETLRSRRRLAAADEAGHRAAQGVGAPFAYAEVAGWFRAPAALARTLRPARRASRSDVRVATVPVLDGGRGFDLEQRVLLAASLLTIVGLTEGFAPLVVLCGHGAVTVNNPHAAALDCGACGGAPGGTNARVAAAICNDPGVRRALKAQGIDIPAETRFLAAEHDTVADVVTVLDREQVPRAWHGHLAELDVVLAAAGDALATERSVCLPGLSADLRHGGGDWARTRPEWGLAGNAAFVVGPRSSTLGLDLGRRVFLHSYRAELDPEGRALATILTAPLIVAHWINAQYHFSTIDPDRFGAGDKLLHNPVGGIGVTLGDGGDLQVGLPLQSVAFGGQPVHEPLRLLAVVEAPLERTAGIVDGHRELRHLVDNGWIALVGREGPGRPWFRRAPDGRWVAWDREQDVGDGGSERGAA